MIPALHQRPPMDVLSHNLPPADQRHGLEDAWKNHSLPDLEAWLASGNDASVAHRGRSLVGWAAASGWGAGVMRLLAAGSVPEVDVSGTSPLFLLFSAAMIENGRGSRLTPERWGDVARGASALLGAIPRGPALRLVSPAYGQRQSYLNLPEFLPLLQRLPTAQVLRLFELRRPSAREDPAPPAVLGAWTHAPKVALWLWGQVPEETHRRWATSPSLAKALIKWSLSDPQHFEEGCARLIAAGACPGQSWESAPFPPKGVPPGCEGFEAALGQSWLGASLHGGAGRIPVLTETLLEAGALRLLPDRLRGPTGALVALLAPALAHRLTGWGWRGPTAPFEGAFVARWLSNTGRWGAVPGSPHLLVQEPGWGIDPHRIPDAKGQDRPLLHHLVTHCQFATEGEIDAWIQACPGFAAMAAGGSDTPLLHHAIEQGQPTWVQRLLAHGFEADVRNNQGQTALLHALRAGSRYKYLSTRGYLEIAAALHQAGASAMAVDGEGNLGFHPPSYRTAPYRPLGIGLSWEEVRDRMVFLKGIGGCPDTPNADGQPPLHAAVDPERQLWSSDWVRGLLACGADPTRLNAQGETLLHRLARLDAPINLAVVLGAPALADPRLNAPDAQGCRPLHLWVLGEARAKGLEETDKALLDQWITAFPEVGPENDLTRAAAEILLGWSEQLPDHAGLQQFRWLWSLTTAPILSERARPRL